MVLRETLKDLMADIGPLDGLGWPEGANAVHFGSHRLTRLAVPGHTGDSVAYLFSDNAALLAALVGDTVMPGALGRSDFPVSAPLAYGPSLKALEKAIGRDTLLLPGHDYDDRFATTLAVECGAQPLLDGVLSGRLSAEAFATQKADLERDLAPTEYQTMACGARVDCGGKTEKVELGRDELDRKVKGSTPFILIDVREAFEQRMSPLVDAWHPASESGVLEQVPLSVLVNQLPRWLSLSQDVPLVFCCRSGNRSAQAARALRRLGHALSYSLAGGFALLPPASPVSLAAAAI